MRVLETRKRGIFKYRKYKAADGSISYTYELPADLLFTALEKAGMKELIPQRAADRIKKAAAIELIKQGWKSIAIAHELGLSDSSINYYKREMKNG